MDNIIGRLRGKYLLGVFFFFALGGFLRFFNLNWDRGNRFHPDEQLISEAVSRFNKAGGFDLGFFPYGGLVFYLYRLFAGALAFLTGDNYLMHDASAINFAGRIISASVSTFSIYLIYKIAKELMSIRGAFLCVFLAAFNVGLIQNAHYATVESLSVFFLMMICLFSVRILKLQGNFFKDWVLLSVLCGLSLGTKIQALSFLAIPLFTWGVLFDKREKTGLFLAAFLFFSIVTIIFFLAYPYRLISLKGFIRTSLGVLAMGTGYLKVPFTLQFHKTAPYWFSFKNLVWYNGPIVLIAGTIGILSGLFLIWRRRKDSFMLPFLLFSVLYFGYMASCYTKFVRYMLFLVPALLLYTCWFVDKVMSFEKFRKLNRILTILIVLSTVIWSLAFMSIYFREDTRIEAAKWIYASLPSGSKLLTEAEDLQLPVSCVSCGYGDFLYLGVTDNFAPDNITKISLLSKKLADADYLILPSRRGYQNIIRAPELYPLASRYYKKLFAGQIGYVLAKEFKSYPRIFNIEINDDASEETFQVFDHPVVRIFKNKQRLSWYEIRDLLLERKQSRTKEVVTP